MVKISYSESGIFMKRIKLHDRLLPKYSVAEEFANTLTHGLGVLLGFAVLVLCLLKADSLLSAVGGWIYGISMIALYAVSATYHGLKPGTAKKVMQVLDHCTIYLLIAGTYTPILLTAFVMHSPAVGWGLMLLQWGTALFAITLNAIDLKRFRVFSYTAYIVMGWSIIFVAPTAGQLLSRDAILYVLIGGISYTVGAILYAIGSKKPWFHSAFHLFVLAGSFLQFLGIYLYIM